MFNSAKTMLFAGTAVLATLGTVQQAKAAYAYASNQITGLGIFFSTTTGVFVGNVTPTTYSATANGVAIYNGVAGPPGFDSSMVVGQAVDPAQSTVGPGAFPAQNIFAQAMAPGSGNYGTRADAAIGAGGLGTVTVSNVAEASSPSGTAIGTSIAQSGNGSTSSFTFTGIGQALTISFALSLIHI